jgi:hypothetical protein
MVLCWGLGSVANVPWYVYAATLVLAIVLQELSHVVFKEPTYMKNYNERRLQKWSIHRALLIPLLLT